MDAQHKPKYYYKYLKYKNKYLELKYNQNGGIYSSYFENGEQIDVIKTMDGNYVSYITGNNNLKNYNITDNPNAADNTKILVINTTVLFDRFTKKYGKITKSLKEKSNVYYIDWKKVSYDFKGFYLDTTNVDMVLNRKSVILSGDFSTISWWTNEYDITNVIIFKH